MRVKPEYSGEARILGSFLGRERLVLAAMLLFLSCQCALARGQSAAGQTAAPETTEQKIDRLTAAVTQAQAQMEAYQQQLLELRQQLMALQEQMAAEKAAALPAAQAATSDKAGAAAATGASATIEEIRERQAIEESPKWRRNRSIH